MRIAVDWDHTLVDERGDWLPGALDALRWMRRQGHRVTIHSCRANYPQGRAVIEEKLARHKLGFGVVGKFDADVYVDNLAARYDDNWPEVLRQIRADAA